MKTLIIAFTLSQLSLASTIVCNGNGYELVADDVALTAELSKDGHKLSFGHLGCTNVFTQEVREEGVPLLSCDSTQVVDAGYSAYLFSPHGTEGINGWLYEVTIAGAKKISDLTCTKN